MKMIVGVLHIEYIDVGKESEREIDRQVEDVSYFYSEQLFSYE
jgi:hypothetical protein